VLLLVGFGFYYVVSPPVFLDYSANGPDYHAYRIALERSFTLRSVGTLIEIHNGPADLRAAEKAAEKAGIPLVLSSLPPPPEQNAARLYDQWHKLRNKKLSAFDLQSRFTPLSLNYHYTSAQLSVIQSFYNKNAPAEVTLVSATDKPRLYYPIDNNLDFKLIDLMDSAAFDIRGRSVLLVHEGKTKDAIRMQCRDFLMADQIAQLPGEGPFLDLGRVETKALHPDNPYDMQDHKRTVSNISENKPDTT
jgi:hypothetical protein